MVQAFRQTGMGRSIAAVPKPSPGLFYHRLSNRHYTIGTSSIRRHQEDAAGKVVNVLEKPVSFAIGSGNHAVTYVSRTVQGRLLELPVSWYAGENAYAMSPGYDRADHFDFRREISESCLFCHSDGPAPEPIGCGRCHGPAAAHLKQPRAGTILNPARLEPPRRLEVCLQCHLETASRGMIDSLRRPGRAVFSFRPGDALAGYKLYFDRADSTAAGRMEINHSGFRLLQSRCYTASGGRLTCTTCHDPHSARVRAGVCQTCHKQPHTTGDCTACHMPKRVASDAIHTRMTDHLIAREPRFTDPTAEDHAPYQGPVVDFYTRADPLSLEFANTRDPEPGLLRRLLARDPRNAALLTALGNALLRRGSARAAADTLRRALALNPRDSDALNYLAVSEAVRGNHREALAILRKAVDANPDHALCRLNLGITYEALGETEEALAAYSEAIRLQPDSSEARHKRQALLTARRAGQR